MNTSHLTDEEIISCAINDYPVCAIDIAKRFESRLDDIAAAENSIPEKDAVTWAVAVMSEHAGEDFHQDIVDQLFEALDKNKPEMKQEIKSVINQLIEFDRSAMEEIIAMQQDGIQ